MLLSTSVPVGAFCFYSHSMVLARESRLPVMALLSRVAWDLSGETRDLSANDRTGLVMQCGRDPSA
jgi:hypothetical protein